MQCVCCYGSTNRCKTCEPGESEAIPPKIKEHQRLCNISDRITVMALQRYRSCLATLLWRSCNVLVTRLDAATHPFLARRKICKLEESETSLGPRSAPATLAAAGTAASWPQKRSCRVPGVTHNVSAPTAVRSAAKLANLEGVKRPLQRYRSYQRPRNIPDRATRPCKGPATLKILPCDAPMTLL